MRYLVSLVLVFITLSFVSGFDSTDLELLQVIVITRHGDRTPTKVFPNTLSLWPEGLGQLTHVGMNQHYNLGLKYRKRYIEDLKFINETYKMNEVYVRSTPRERTLMSAHSFMHGLYPPGSGPSSMPHNIQPVAIFSADRNADTLLYAYKNCPQLKILNQLDQTGEDWTSLTTKHSSLLASLTNIFGRAITLKDVTAVLNIIHGETIHNRPTLSGVTQDMMNTMDEIAKFVFNRKFYTREMGKLGAGLLAKDIRDRFNNSISIHKTTQSKVDSRFVLFSAHDGTLLALMSALNLKHLEVPHYASHFAFELYYDKANSQYLVSILYNEDRIFLHDCSSNSKSCLFEDWASVISDGIPLNWESECGVASKPLVTATPYFSPHPVVLLLLGFVFGSVSIYILLVTTGKFSTKVTNKYV